MLSRLSRWSIGRVCVDQEELMVLEAAWGRDYLAV